MTRLLGIITGLARRDVLLQPSTIPCCRLPFLSAYPFVLEVYCPIRFFDTQASSVTTDELVLSRHARGVLSSPRSDGHGHLSNYYFSRIVRIENFS